MAIYATPKQIGDHNKNQMLSILRERGPTSRAELSRLLGISSVAVSRNTAQLLNKGIIRENGAQKSGLGRKPIPVTLCNDFCYVLGADVVGGKLKTALADLMGNIIKYHEEPVLAQKGAHAVLSQLVNALKKMIVSSGIAREKIWALTVGTPGIYNKETGKSQLAFFIEKWEDINLHSRIFEALRIETIIENDVNLDIIGESWKGIGKDYENILYVKLGQGLASKYVIQNKLVRGEHNMAGEIGLMVPGLPPGNKGNYEQSLSNAAAVSRYKKAGGRKQVQTISDLRSLAIRGDTAARKIMRQLLDEFAVVLLNCATVLDPQVIILGGEASNFSDVEIASIRNRIEKHFPLVEHIIPSSLDMKACIYGAIKTGLDRIEERITEIW